MASQMESPSDRRPIAARELGVSQRLARALASAGVTANAISLAGLACGILGGIALAATGCPEYEATRRVWWLLGAGLVPLRLLANMLDGMVALETDQDSPLGALYNELPDRIADVAVLVGAGYAFGGSVALGLWASILALLTAYVRAQGAVAGAPQAFHGPMAKPHRMFVIIAAALFGAAAPASWQYACPDSGMGVMAGALGLILVGSAITCLRRLAFVARSLRGIA